MESKVAKNTSNCRSLSVNISRNFIAIKPLLQQQLIAAMNLAGTDIAPANLPSDLKLMSQMIPLHRLSDNAFAVYRCAIAFKLAPLWQLPAFDIANQLVASLPINTQNTSNQICLDFTIEVVFPGWINFRLSSQGLAAWLQQSLQTSPNQQGQLDKNQKEAHNLFPAQYAHARCCSLLRLAHQQDLIKLQDLSFKTLSYPFIEPHPIPWLDNDQQVNTTTGQVQLRLVHPAEQHLIAQLLDWQDAINIQNQGSSIKLASALSNAFETFYSSCRILGEVKIDTPKLAQARLGLLGLTQIILRSLLQDQLGVAAPTEL
jgi:arginyl-tRNA synthetase